MSTISDPYLPGRVQQVLPEQTSTEGLEVYLRTRVLRCGCGFQMEIPE